MAEDRALVFSPGDKVFFQEIIKPGSNFERAFLDLAPAGESRPAIIVPLEVFPEDGGTLQIRSGPCVFNDYSPVSFVPCEPMPLDREADWYSNFRHAPGYQYYAKQIQIPVTRPDTQILGIDEAPHGALVVCHEIGHAVWDQRDPNFIDDVISNRITLDVLTRFGGWLASRHSPSYSLDDVNGGLIGTKIEMQGDEIIKETGDLLARRFGKNGMKTLVTSIVNQATKSIGDRLNDYRSRKYPEDNADLFELVSGVHRHQAIHVSEQAVTEERRAWLEGLQLARRIRDERGVNCWGGNRQDLQEIVRNGILSSAHFFLAPLERPIDRPVKTRIRSLSNSSFGVKQRMK